MAERSIQKITVVGAGVIGSSWASYFLAHGFDVAVTDLAPDAEAKLHANVESHWRQLTAIGLSAGAAPCRLRFEPSLEKALENADFVQENGPERIDVKHDIYRKLDALTAPDTLLASSTSGLLVSDIQTVCKHPERVVLGHPFNPPHLIPLVEVVGGRLTSPESIARAMAFYGAIGKRPIHLKREMQGHVANRLQAALWREAFYLVDKGIATVSDIDTAIESGPGLRWALLGPFMNLDLSGGEGGIRHVLDHLGPPMENWWHDLGDPALTSGVCQKVVDGARAELLALGDRGEVERRRDDRLVKLLALKAEEL